MRMIAVLGATVALCGAASAQPISDGEVGRAQGAMIVRVSEKVDSYARSIGLDSSVVTFCRAQMDLDARLPSADGSIPFGVNYNTISSREQLSLVITVREDFETNYLKLCLANYKNALTAAAAR